MVRGISFFAGSWRKFDWILMASSIILSLIGLAAIYSVDLSRSSDMRSFPTQLVALGLGILVMLMAASFHVSWYENTARVGYVVVCLLLICVLWFGVTVRGTTGWFHVFGFSFQPAELAKVVLVIFLAWRISRQGRRFDRWQFIVGSGIMTGIFVLLILLQPDLGSALLLIGIWAGLLVATGIPKRYIILLATLFAVTFVSSWFFLFQDYQRERILTFLDPSRDPLSRGYNVTQSIIAIGAGQIFGRGLGFGSQSQLHFLPEAQTDFIFAVIGEELGFVGVSIVMVMYGIISWRLLRIARLARSDFSAYLSVGVLIALVIQMFINIGAAVGILPVTGVTLPFISYGGSSLIMMFLFIGITQSVARSS